MEVEEIIITHNDGTETILAITEDNRNNIQTKLRNLADGDTVKVKTKQSASTDWMCASGS